MQKGTPKRPLSYNLFFTKFTTLVCFLAFVLVQDFLTETDRLRCNFTVLVIVQERE